jgi:hypothetical protein
LSSIGRSTVYYRPRPVSDADLQAMRRIDQLHLAYPTAGARMLRDILRREDIAIGRRHVATLMASLQRFVGGRERTGLHPALVVVLRCEPVNPVFQCLKPVRHTGIVQLRLAGLVLGPDGIFPVRDGTPKQITDLPRFGPITPEHTTPGGAASLDWYR